MPGRWTHLTVVLLVGAPLLARAVQDRGDGVPVARLAFPGHTGPISLLQFSADGKTLVCGVGGQAVPDALLSWSTADWKPRGPVVRAKFSEIEPVCLSPDLKLLLGRPAFCQLACYDR